MFFFWPECSVFTLALLAVAISIEAMEIKTIKTEVVDAKDCKYLTLRAITSKEDDLKKDNNIMAKAQ